VSAPAAESSVAPERSEAPAGRDRLHDRPIRSFVLRRSHFSAAQRDAHQRLMPRFGLAWQPVPLDLATVFGRTAPTVLEIGFGMGDTTAEIARNAPDVDFLAVDVHTPGVGALLKQVEQQALGNIRIIEHDARAVVESMLADGSLAGIHVFFPDPWPKARHHKRRLIRQPFLGTLVGKLRPGGHLHVATDWPDYADQMIEALDAIPTLAAAMDDTVLAGAAATPASAGWRPGTRPSTKFERRGLQLGHPIRDILRYRRTH